MRISKRSSFALLVQLLSLIAFWGIFSTTLSNTAVAAPAGDLQARACPTAGDLARQFTAQGVGDNTVFWTGPKKVDRILAFSSSLTPKGKWYEDVVNDKLMQNLKNLCGSDRDEQWKIVQRISEGLALASSETAYMLIEKGQNPKEGESVWKRIEFPTLMRNTLIKKIVRVDPDDISTTSVIWTPKDGVDLDVEYNSPPANWNPPNP